MTVETKLTQSTITILLINTCNIRIHKCTGNTVAEKHCLLITEYLIRNVAKLITVG